ncbi:TRAP transporter small permease [Hoeflea olei]|uniref:TRAP transporter small permease protein n=1 Tax=Hoeflea olei TaxID=1480615 RepID=A0A1C1Z0F7_9HYPH|nr:TRAP transporter small permease [Hoeflea olei]OCW59244.1 C4-dicarboxylate ABC transporter [Hoeflea olei]
MRETMTRVAQVTGAMARAALWISGAGLVLMTVLIACQVFWRYVLNDSISWTEPGSVMIMGWFIFLGAAVGIREGYHLSFDILVHLVSDQVRDVMRTLSDLVVIAFGGGMVVYGAELALNAAPNVLPSLGISGAFDFLPLVAGGLLVVLFSVERIARRLAGLPTAAFGEAVAED